MISLLFRLINLALIAGVGVYLIRRFGMPRLKQGVSQHEQEKTILDREQATLKNLHVQLDRELITQENLCTELSAKVDQWQEYMLAKQAQAQQEQAQVYAALEKRYNQQQENYSLVHAVKQVTPVVQQQLEKELNEYYTNTGEAQEYIGAVVEHLRKST